MLDQGVKKAVVVTIGPLLVVLGHPDESGPGLLVQVGPPPADLLGDLGEGELGHGGPDLRPDVVAEEEEGRHGLLWGRGVLPGLGHGDDGGGGDGGGGHGGGLYSRGVRALALALSFLSSLKWFNE